MSSPAIPQSLRDLKFKAETARAAYHAHKPTDGADLDAQVAYDIEDKRLLRASTAARVTYEAALEAFVASEAA